LSIAARVYINYLTVMIFKRKRNNCREIKFSTFSLSIFLVDVDHNVKIDFGLRIYRNSYILFSEGFNCDHRERNTPLVPKSNARGRVERSD